MQYLLYDSADEQNGFPSSQQPLLVATPIKSWGSPFWQRSRCCARLTHRQLLMLPFDLLSRPRRSFVVPTYSIQFICSFAIRQRCGREKWIVHWSCHWPAKGFSLPSSLFLYTGINAFIYLCRDLRDMGKSMFFNYMPICTACNCMQQRFRLARKDIHDRDIRLKKSME